METGILTSELVSKVISWWFGLVLLFFVLITLILDYHWKQYGITPKTLKRLRKIYFWVSAVLIVVASILFLIFILA